MVDNHFKYLHNLFIIKNSLSFTYYYLFYRIGTIPLDSKYQILLDLKIAFSISTRILVLAQLMLVILWSMCLNWSCLCLHSKVN